MGLYIIVGFIWVCVILDIYVLCKTSTKGRLYITDDDEVYLRLDIPIEEVRRKKFLKLSVKQLKGKTDSRE